MIATQVSEHVADTGAVLAVMVTAATLLVMLWVWVGRPIWREWKINREFQEQFRSDWRGVPERDGVPGRPGVMSRLSEMANDWTHLSDKVRRLEKEMVTVRAQIAHLMSNRCPNQHLDGSGEFVMTYDTSPTAPEDERG